MPFTSKNKIKNIHCIGQLIFSKLQHRFFLFIDREAPSFGETCPTARSVFADEGKTSATVTWGPVTATDNDQAIVTVSPLVTSPHVFSEGSHTVVYTATDPSGNTKLCYFHITVQGENKNEM